MIHTRPGYQADRAPLRVRLSINRCRALQAWRLRGFRSARHAAMYHGYKWTAGSWNRTIG